MNRVIVYIVVATSALWLVACTSNEQKKPDQELAEYVDLNRFMGTWYVHGYTPTILDGDAYDATESYELGEDGKIRTTYRFRKGSHKGKWKTMKPVGWVYDKATNAEWRMKFFGVFTAPYYILYVSEDYSETVIGHPDRDMAWIMTRSPTLSDRDYERLLGELARRDYDLDSIERIVHIDS